MRVGDLPDELRAHIWQHVRDNGYFFDSEKKEYLEIEEVRNLDPQLQQGLRSALKRGLDELLSQRKVSELPERMQASIESYLDQQDYFLDQDRMAHFVASKAEELEPEIYATACQYLGQRSLAEIDGQRFSELDHGLRQEIEKYLEGSDYFLDKAEREKFLQRRLADLDGELFEGLLESLGREMAQGVVDQQVAELDESDRELLRGFLDSIGYFVDQDALARFEEGMLTDLNLDKGDYEALASWLGERALREKAGQRFTDLEEGLRRNIERYLGSTGYFLNAQKLQHFREQSFADLDEYVELAGRFVSTVKASGSDVLILAEPNAGRPELVEGKAIYNVSPEDFAAAAEKIHSMGVTIIGGCCGTGPEHIEAVAKKLK